VAPVEFDIIPLLSCLSSPLFPHHPFHRPGRLFIPFRNLRLLPILPPSFHLAFLALAILLCRVLFYSHLPAFNQIHTTLSPPLSSARLLFRLPSLAVRSVLQPCCALRPLCFASGRLMLAASTLQRARQVPATRFLVFVSAELFYAARRITIPHGPVGRHFRHHSIHVTPLIAFPHLRLS